MAVTDMSCLKDKHSAELLQLGREVLEAKENADTYVMQVFHFLSVIADFESRVLSNEQEAAAWQKEKKEMGVTINTMEILGTNMTKLTGLVLELQVNALCLLFCVLLQLIDHRQGFRSGSAKF
jgi:hypothetical protein